jgi:8-oxo-dGTP pyrophosphatase MutT (NUDIX family)
VITSVRALLVTASGSVLLMRRTKVGVPIYWVMPGGGIERRDATLEDAVIREVREETGAVPSLHRLIHVADAGAHGRHAIFLALLDGWSLSNATGPEFDDPANGYYHLDEYPMTAATFRTVNPRPSSTSALAADTLEAGGDLFKLPDVRDSGPLDWGPRGG